jgi:hypothetical protein
MTDRLTIFGRQTHAVQQDTPASCVGAVGAMVVGASLADWRKWAGYKEPWTILWLTAWLAAHGVLLEAPSIPRPTDRLLRRPRRGPACLWWEGADDQRHITLWTGSAHIDPVDGLAQPTIVCPEFAQLCSVLDLTIVEFDRNLATQLLGREASLRALLWRYQSGEYC